jgi:hypothetical protein
MTLMRGNRIVEKHGERREQRKATNDPKPNPWFPRVGKAEAEDVIIRQVTLVTGWQS